jgi:hypothetical protein
MRLLTGFYVSQAIHVAATLGIADHLRDGPRSSDELAAATGCHPHALYRLLRALASLGVFREEAERRFTLRPVSEYVRADHPESVGPLAVFLGQPDLWQAWGALLHSVKTREYAFGQVRSPPNADQLSPLPSTITCGRSSGTSGSSSPASSRRPATTWHAMPRPCQSFTRR